MKLTIPRVPGAEVIDVQFSSGAVKALTIETKESQIDLTGVDLTNDAVVTVHRIITLGQNYNPSDAQ